MTRLAARPGHVLDRITYVAAWITIPLAALALAFIIGQAIGSCRVATALRLPGEPKIALRALRRPIPVLAASAEAVR